jgi:thiol-disulfide isomerase/thioredoxin
MKPFYFCLFTFYFLLAVACRPAAAPVSISNKPVSINRIPQTNLPMPPTKPLGEMTWTNFDGKTLSDGNIGKVKDLQGKVVVLDFWATYCPPCIEEIPHLNSLQAKYGAENLQIIGLHVGGEEDRPRIPAFLEKVKTDYSLATPEEALVGFVFSETDIIPQTLILDRDGKLAKRYVGFNENIKKDLDRVIEQAISEK